MNDYDIEMLEYFIEDAVLNIVCDPNPLYNNYIDMYCWYIHLGPIYLYALTEIMGWIDNHIEGFIIHPCSNISGGLTKPHLK